ncbi:hypothetical protein AMTR_s00052p00189480 [Amborella trichopoda]|uniref:Uncharacterized protein n=1 Tax=Amborella trichopoda TaxID=13333 RepID=U5D1Z3_AMBTC|nr:hypothetical protein AMTR_s00052p00189480 [Amborella trichopoda]
MAKFLSHFNAQAFIACNLCCLRSNYLMLLRHLVSIWLSSHSSTRALIGHTLKNPYRLLTKDELISSNHSWVFITHITHGSSLMLLETFIGRMPVSLNDNEAFISSPTCIFACLF